MRLRAAAIREYAAGSLWVVPAVASVEAGERAIVAADLEEVRAAAAWAV